MKPIQQQKDPRITNISFDNFTGSFYIIGPSSSKKNQGESMLTSPRTNGADHFVPSHHLALITQPVLGARSRSRRKTKNIIIETPTSKKDKLDSMTSSRRSSYNDSPPLILPINRVDTLQYQRKTNSNSHHESSDSGLDLSISTNSSVQQYPQQHIPIHRPLSALNEDSSPDDGYHDEHQQPPSHNAVRLRFPPVSFRRNRSTEDMISNNTHEQQQQHRSSSFSDEQQQQKLALKKEQKIKRSSDGVLLGLLDTSPQPIEPYQRTNTSKNELFYPSITQQHRSLNDLTNKTSNKALLIRNESTMSTPVNNLPATNTIIRKPNTSTLKPLRKKTKLNIIVEPSVPLTSSRLAVYDEQTNRMNGTSSSSSNQTTPRSNHPLSQQQIKSKQSTPLGYYSNQEQMKAHVNRSVIERQHLPTLPGPPRRGVIQQMIPFDASPSKVNNLLKHHVQQHQPTILFHPNSNSQLSPSRQIKQTLPTLYDEETISNIKEEKRKQIKFKEQEEKKRLKQKDEFENNKSNETHQKRQGKIKIKDIQEPISLKIIPKRQNQYEHNDPGGIYRDDNRQRRTIVNNFNRNTTGERYGSGQSSSTTGKSYDSNHINRRQQRNADPVRIDGEQRIHRSKPTGLVVRNKTQNNNLNRTTETNNQYGPDYSHSSQKNTLVGLQTRPSKIHSQTSETSTTRDSSVQTQIDQNRQLNQWENSKYVHDHYPWQKSQLGSQSKPNRIQPINTNIYDSRRERETSRLSNISKTDSIQFKQKFIEKNSTGNLQTISPTSWSVISQHQNDQQQLEIYEKTSTYQSDVSASPSSHDELIGDNSSTPSRTYRLLINDQQQPIDGRYVVPSNNLKASSIIDQSSHTSSYHTYPFTCTSDFETNNDILIENSSRPIENKNQKSFTSDVYTLSDHERLQNIIDRRNSPSPLVHLTPNKKFSTPPPPPITTTTTQVIIPAEKDESASNYDSDDGWSDDSAELLYVDERYATEKIKMTPSSHLSSQQQYHYHLQQQNVLLQ